MTTTTSLAERVEQMRKLGVARWREGDFEIELGPAPVSEPERIDAPSLEAALRQHVPLRMNVEGRDPFMNLTEEEQTDLFNAVISPVKGA